MRRACILMEQVKIIIDNRERNGDLIDALQGSGASLDFTQLPVGDYIVSDRMCIERKTVQDFENSIMDNRLFDQLERLSSGFEKPVVILEGTESEHRLSKNVITGTMIKLCTDYTVQVLRSTCPSDTAAILLKLAEREQIEDSKEPRIMGQKKAHTTYQWQTLILGSMPGIGPSLARRLISHFGSVKGVANASAKELMEVDKIGRKKAQAICNILNAKFEPKVQMK